MKRDWDKFRRQQRVWKNGSTPFKATSPNPKRNRRKNRSKKRHSHKPQYVPDTTKLRTLVASANGIQYRATYQKFGPKWKLISADSALEFLRYCGPENAPTALAKRRLQWHWHFNQTTLHKAA